MIDCKDIETQANFPEESYPGILYKLPINFLHKRMSRVKNPLETVNQYKKRIIRIQKERNLLAVSVTLEPKSYEKIAISGNRCYSVELAKKNEGFDRDIRQSLGKIQRNGTILPKLGKKFKYDKFRYVKNSLCGVINSIIA